MYNRHWQCLLQSYVEVCFSHSYALVPLLSFAPSLSPFSIPRTPHAAARYKEAASAVNATLLAFYRTVGTGNFVYQSYTEEVKPRDGAVLIAFNDGYWPADKLFNPIGVHVASTVRELVWTFCAAYPVNYYDRYACCCFCSFFLSLSVLLFLSFSLLCCLGRSALVIFNPIGVHVATTAKCPANRLLRQGMLLFMSSHSIISFKVGRWLGDKLIRVHLVVALPIWTFLTNHSAPLLTNYSAPSRLALGISAFFSILFTLSS